MTKNPLLGPSSSSSFLSNPGSSKVVIFAYFTSFSLFLPLLIDRYFVFVFNPNLFSLPLFPCFFGLFIR